MAIIGIDLGTTNSLAAVWRDGKSVLIPNELGEVLTPSAVSMGEDGAVLVGKAARERAVSHPDRTATAFKRDMGTERRYRLGEREFTPEELSALVLRKLREDAEAFLGESVEEAVVSVPAYFNDRQRSATKRAGALAGMRVERLINEPSAAALACRMENPEGDCSFLVFDFGGGTLDVSVVDCFDNMISITAVSGDNTLGGADFDRAVAECFCSQSGVAWEELSAGDREILLRQAEQCKMALSTQNAVMMMAPGICPGALLTLSNQKLIEICAASLVKMETPLRRALRDSGLSLAEISRIIPVGGSCKMPVVRQYLEKLTRRRIAGVGEPDTVVALGVGAYAGIKARDPQVKNLVLTDICPFTLSSGVLNEADPQRPLCFPIIERNTVLPASREKSFVTVRNGQEEVNVEIYQGEERYCEDNLRLGQVRCPVPAGPAGSEEISVRFTYDINGILEVEVAVCSTGEKRRELIVGEGSGITPEQARARMEELALLKISPRDQAENRLIIARGERLYRESVGPVREQVSNFLSAFEQSILQLDPVRVARMRKRAERFLDELERRGDPFAGLEPDFDGENEE